MKPFDLEKALAGAKVVTRDGREVTQLSLFNAAIETPLVGVVGNNELGAWTIEGRRYLGAPILHNDLFMAAEKKEEWGYAIKFNRGGPVSIMDLTFTNSEAAKLHADATYGADEGQIFVFKIREWEE